MLGLNLDMPFLKEAGYLGPARVVRSSEEGDRVLLRHEGLPDGRDAWARIALPLPNGISKGTTVLALGNGEDLYVIGVLDGTTDAPSRKLSLPGGAYAETAGPPHEPRLRVFSAEQELLFELDERTGKARVRLGAGDVELSAGGNLEFVSAQDIRFQGRSVGLTARQDVSIDARRGHLRIDETLLAGKRLDADLDTARLTLRRLETTARTVVEKARDVYRTVDRLVQTRAGRIRTLVSGALYLKSRKAFLKSEKDFKIDGEKIHLG